MKYETISNVSSLVMSGYAIANIKEILGVVILVLSILNILFNAGMRIYNHIKNKRYEEISKEIEKTKEDLNNIKEEL